MRTIRLSLWAWLGLLTALWLSINLDAFRAETFFAIRAFAVQYSGLIAIGCMSACMVLATRPRWAERRLGGLDKGYRLHKWLGIGALAAGLIHWGWAKGPKFAVGLGLLDRPHRGPRPAPEGVVDQMLHSLHGPAEGLGEWAFYAALVLLVLALWKRFPYRLFAKTHKLLAAAYLVLVFHALVLVKPETWPTPLGAVLALMLAYGAWAAVLVLSGRVGAHRKADGTISKLRHYAGVKVLEIEVEVGSGWPGHRAGQFAFATSNPAEGAHPYTIASAWNPQDPRITFLVKELGDHTSRLKDTLELGQDIILEGPYGAFTFDDSQPSQIWVGGGIGITPFVARMKQLAAGAGRPGQRIHLFHTTRDVDVDAMERLKNDAQAAGVTLHLLVDGQDGLLDARRIRALVPDWQRSSVWFCGPAAFGRMLKTGLEASGMAGDRFHQELFQMR